MFSGISSLYVKPQLGQLSIDSRIIVIINLIKRSIICISIIVIIGKNTEYFTIEQKKLMKYPRRKRRYPFKHHFKRKLRRIAFMFIVAAIAGGINYYNKHRAENLSEKRLNHESESFSKQNSN